MYFSLVTYRGAVVAERHGNARRENSVPDVFLSQNGWSRGPPLFFRRLIHPADLPSIARTPPSCVNRISSERAPTVEQRFRPVYARKERPEGAMNAEKDAYTEVRRSNIIIVQPIKYCPMEAISTDDPLRNNSAYYKELHSFLSVLEKYIDKV